jgi:translation elongation factor EF-4
LGQQTQRSRPRLRGCLRLRLLEKPKARNKRMKTIAGVDIPQMAFMTVLASEE